MGAGVGIVYFPGTNCEHDVARALRRLGGTSRLVFHTEESLEDYDGVVVPGGFAHGDYLRPGAIARFSPVMASLGRFAAAGGPVLGICNGFQVLTEAGLLPGALMRNDGLRFICATVSCTVRSTRSVLSSGASKGDVLRLPINHYEGNYTCSSDQLVDLEQNDQIVLRYDDNPNGSTGSIAGVSNVAGNVVGLMPHPERASDALLGSEDGNVLLASFLNASSRYGAARAAGVAR